MVDGGFVAIDDRISDGNRLDVIKNMVDSDKVFIRNMISLPIYLYEYDTILNIYFQGLNFI